MQVRHPELGPATSLLVTDIQSSTTLWEVLPAGVMDRAVRMHHQLLRSLMQEHKGYETCTEVGMQVGGRAVGEEHASGRAGCGRCCLWV